MALPSADVVLSAELSADAFDGAAVATGSGLAGVGEDDPAVGGATAAGADVPPKLLT